MVTSVINAYRQPTTIQCQPRTVALALQSKYVEPYLMVWVWSKGVAN